MDIALDVPVRRSADWHYVFQPGTAAVAAARKGYAAVYHGERYICAIDRGDVPEFKIYGIEDGFEAVDMSEISRYDDTKVSYIEIQPHSHFYHAALTKAERGDDNFTKTEDGKVFMYEAFRWSKVRGAVQKLGWRHTFESLLRAGIEGVTRKSLSRKFGVDMFMYPNGSPEDIHSALFEE